MGNFWGCFTRKKSQSLRAKINYKGMIKLVNISKEEAHELNKKYGVNFGCNGISHTYTKHKKYFLCENPKNINALKKVRDAKVKR